MIAPLAVFEPDLAVEQATITVRGDADISDGDYGFVELYCTDPGCDCRRVSLQVIAGHEAGIVASISHAFEGGDLHPKLGRTFVDPLQIQGKAAQAWLPIVEQLLDEEDGSWNSQLEAHYHETRQALADPEHPCHGRLAKGPAVTKLRLPPGSVGTKADPVMLRVNDEAALGDLAGTMNKMGIQYIIGVEPGEATDLSDLDLIGLQRPPPVGLSRIERRLWKKRRRGGKGRGR